MIRHHAALAWSPIASNWKICCWIRRIPSEIRPNNASATPRISCWHAISDPVRSNSECSASISASPSRGWEPRPAAPYFRRPSEAKDHAFDRERCEAIPGSWLKSHGRSLVRYHLHPETKFQGGEFDQCGPLARRHVFALARQSIGKEADNIEENEFIGEDTGPPDYGVVQHDRAALANAVFNIQQRYDLSDRRLLDQAEVSHNTLAALREGKRIADASLMKLFRAAEALRQEADPIGAAKEKALTELRRFEKRLAGGTS